MRTITPVEAEKMMDDMRLLVAFSDTQAVAPIKYTLNGTSSDIKKVIMSVDPLAIHIPAWQRNADLARINDIAQNYDDLMFENVKCIIDKDRLIVVEGQHRAIAMAKRRMDGHIDAMQIKVEVLKCDESRAMKLFLDQGLGRKDPTPADVWRANLQNGNENYVKVKEICDRHNFAIAYDDNKPKNPKSKLVSVSDYTGSPKKPKCRYSTEILDKSLDFLSRLGWCACARRTSVPTAILRMFASLYAHTAPENHEKMENLLIKELGGVASFEMYILTEPTSHYFDVCRSVINRVASEVVVLDEIYKAA